MAKSESGEGGGAKGLWTLIEERLEALGVNLEELGAELANGGPLKVVCVAPGLGESVREMSRSARDQVVMVRVDEETLHKLDAWVETGAVKSRSEAAALFIREGLQVRSDELTELEDALKQVERARKRLRQKAKTVFGGGADGEPDEKAPS